MTLPPVFRGDTRKLLLRLVANGIVQAVATVATALVVRWLFDAFMNPAGSVDGRLLALASACLAVAGGGMFWLRVLERTDAARLGEDYVSKVRLRVFDHLTRLSLAAQRRRGRGALMLRFVTDLTAVRQWVSQGLARLTVAGIAAFGALAVLAYLNPAIAAAIIVILMVCGGAAYSAGARLEVRVGETRRRRSSLATNVGDKLAALATVQAFGQMRRERGRIKRQSRALADSMVARARVTGLVRGLPDAAVSFATIAILVVGAWQMGAGQATPGVMVAAIIVLGVLSRPLRDLGRIFVYWHNFQVSRKKLEKFIEGSATIRDARNAKPLAPGGGRLDFEGVQVAGGLVDLSVAAEPGSLVVLAGPGGAGKSTVLALIARLLDPSAGRILLDGRNIAGVSLDSLRAAIGVVSPDLPLMRGSIRRNLRYRCPRATDSDVARILSLCELTDDIAGLPQGQDTRLVEGGMNLPAGMRQRIALARALLGGPRLLLLDEPGTNLDPRSRAILHRILEERVATALVVTHDRSLAQTADAIWYLDQGRLVEHGPGSELLAVDGAAARFFGGPTGPEPGNHLVLVS